MKPVLLTGPSAPPIQQLKNGSIKPSKTKVVKLPAQELNVHPHAQRELLPSRLKQLYDEFDLDAIGVLHCVEYEIDGVTGLWIVDGQHRYRVLMDHGFGEWIVEVKIHLDVKDDARASDLFIKLNSRASVQPFDKFKNARTAGYENAVRITRIAKDCGLEVARQAGDGKICCVSALTQAYAIDGGQTLIAALETLVAAWGRTAASVEGKLIEGVAAVYKTYKDGIDRPALVKKLGKYPGGATGLLGDAKGLRQYRHLSVGRCVAERIVEVYNSGRKVGRLDPL